MQTIELFSGTKSFSKVACKLGFNTLTIDNDIDLRPDMLLDINDLDIDKLPKNPFFIWASPPCTCFSVASISKHWSKQGNLHISKTQEASDSVRLVIKTWEIIQSLNPKFWVIENPRGKLRKLDIIPNKYLKTISYCQYGDIRMKPTDIWSNIPFIPRLCRNGSKCHVSAPRGSPTGTQGIKGAKDRGVVPEGFIKELFEVITKC